MNNQAEVGSAIPLLIEFGKKYNIAVSRDHVDTAQVANVLIQTCFKKQVSPEQMTALLIVAKQYGLNPFTREIYAFPDKTGGIVPIVGVDGWCNIINNHENLAGMEFRYSEEMLPLVDTKNMAAHTWCECLLYRKDRDRPIVVREYMGETYKAAPISNGVKRDGAWQSHPNRMLRHKTLIQCARYAFGFTGIYDPDEAIQFIRDTQSFDIVETSQSQSVQAKQENSNATTNNQQSEQSNKVNEVVESKPLNGKPLMNEARFNKNFEKAKVLISQKKQTAETLINTIESSYSLTDEQRQLIINLELEVEAV